MAARLTERLDSVSYGGGVQSNAILVLAAQGAFGPNPPVFLFANVGDDSEHPATLEYVRNIAIPYAEAHNIELVELQRIMRGGDVETLMSRIDRRKSSIPIPVYMGPGGAPGNRTCTLDFKVRVIVKELKRRGFSAERPALTGIGFSVDEIGRVKPSRDPEQQLVYPLIEREITRQGALNLIAEEGLPLPPRSSCYFCPFHTMDEWRRLRRERPDLFQKSVDLEKKMFERGRQLGRGDFYLTRYGTPLDQLVHDQGILFSDEGDDKDLMCDSGHCWT